MHPPETNPSNLPAAVSDGHAHDPHLAHHFATRRQQFESGKLGMWVFLATEILMFGGLFVAYSVYRANHPEIFIYAHRFLDKTLGGINTLVLICSSLTMAWAVRAAQLNQQRVLVAGLILTLMGACGFLSIKYVEYKAKWEHGLLWGRYYNPSHHEADHAASQAATSGETHQTTATVGSAPPAPVAGPSAQGETVANVNTAAAAATTPADGATAASAPADPDAPRIKPAAVGPPGLALADLPAAAHAGVHSEPENVRIFFSIYFLMTGLHGIHVLIGMGLIGWILVRAMRHQFNSRYFTPVDFVGLYWHLVDLIWIFLFPLLYLIH